MVSTGMLRHVAIVRTDVSEELSASFIRVTKIGELEITLAETSNRRTLRLLVSASVVSSSPMLVTLMKEALSSSETSVLTRATRRNVPEDSIPHSHRRENLKSCIHHDWSQTGIPTGDRWRSPVYPCCLRRYLGICLQCERESVST
jgi:hypothetical protein